MADTKTVRGTLSGVTVNVSEETAAALGSDFEQEGSASKSTSSSSSKSSSSK